MPKGTSKVMFRGPKWGHGPPMFDLSFDCGRFGAMPKIIIFGRPRDGPTIDKIEPWSAKASPKALTPFDGAKFLGGRGPQDQWKVGPFDHWTIHKGSRQAVGPKAQRIYIYIFDFLFLACIWRAQISSIYLLIYFRRMVQNGFQNRGSRNQMSETRIWKL